MPKPLNLDPLAPLEADEDISQSPPPSPTVGASNTPSLPKRVVVVVEAPVIATLLGLAEPGEEAVAAAAAAAVAAAHPVLAGGTEVRWFNEDEEEEEEEEEEEGEKVEGDEETTIPPTPFAAFLSMTTVSGE